MLSCFLENSSPQSLRPCSNGQTKVFNPFWQMKADVCKNFTRTCWKTVFAMFTHITECYMITTDTSVSRQSHGKNEHVFTTTLKRNPSFIWSNGHLRSLLELKRKENTCDRPAIDTVQNQHQKAPNMIQRNLPSGTPSDRRLEQRQRAQSQ